MLQVTQALSSPCSGARAAHKAPDLHADPRRCFYSRKSFFFPERQQGPHRDWTEEVRFLDNVFGEFKRRGLRWRFPDADIFSCC